MLFFAKSVPAINFLKLFCQDSPAAWITFFEASALFLSVSNCSATGCKRVSPSPNWVWILVNSFNCELVLVIISSNDANLSSYVRAAVLAFSKGSVSFCKRSDGLNGCIGCSNFSFS